MLRAIIISPDPSRTAELECAIAESGGAAVVRKLASYPDATQLARVLRAHAPRVCFIDAAELAPALETIAAIDAHAPELHVIAFDREAGQAALLALMRAGVREFVPLAAGAAEIAAILERTASAAAKTPPAVAATDLMYTFLPAKPGVGCSTVAMNAAVALAAAPEFRVLLADFDLTCGMIGFLLHLGEDRSIVDAAEHAANLDEQLWPKLVTRRGNLDVLPAGRMQPGFRIEPAQIRYLLEFARRNYNAVVADVSGLMERYSLELMQESKQIFLVCTPELPSVYLARNKVEFLRSVELEDRVRVLLNRTQKAMAVSEREVREIIGLPVSLTLPNDYRGVCKALREGEPLAAASELGRRFGELAEQMRGRDPQPRRARRFVDYFTLSPAKFSFEQKPR